MTRQTGRSFTLSESQVSPDSSETEHNRFLFCCADCDPLAAGEQPRNFFYIGSFHQFYDFSQDSSVRYPWSPPLALSVPAFRKLLMEIPDTLRDSINLLTNEVELLREEIESSNDFFDGEGLPDLRESKQQDADPQE